MMTESEKSLVSPTTTVWCVKHNDGWCAIIGNFLPEEWATNIATVCNNYVIIPLGFERREPDCKECQNG